MTLPSGNKIRNKALFHTRIQKAPKQQFRSVVFENLT